MYLKAFRSLLEPIRFPTTPQVVGVFVATQAATVNVVSVRVDDFVIAHVVAPIGGRTHKVSDRSESGLMFDLSLSQMAGFRSLHAAGSALVPTPPGPSAHRGGQVLRHSGRR